MKDTEPTKVPPVVAVEAEKSLKSWRALGLASSIFICLCTYGYVQERIMTRPWGPNNDEYISNSMFLVMCNRLTSMGVALSVITFKKGEEYSPTAPMKSYMVISLANCMATTCQYEALRYVSFPTQTLGKTAKMIPVMIWGTCLIGKTYKLKDYLVAATVSGGCALFILTGNVTSAAARHADKTTSFMGLFMMVGYLAFDGLTSSWQERLFKKSNTSTWNQMLYVGLLSTVTTMIGQAGARTTIPGWDPLLYSYIMALSLSAAIGQIFILITIKEFGALLFATIMTTRQFLSILLSCILFLHPLSAGQWVGTVMVFGALYYKTLSGGAGKGKKTDILARKDLTSEEMKALQDEADEKKELQRTNSEREMDETVGKV
mmetsp:Transcript_1167/g.2769  ORF Transcript_1167/g.2769 Transcript_1167/m.2769 type:complete len:376 (+) Transcript_1167:79-1206(+)|eukprot:CAMPEP_0172005388 /NCGR_PEP_ID=MMETSP1041-20130122/5017_1 /TAXON_ID=464988 /ORGANISM="Hemiselmis andersenii, Strain CCMP439" /LENGTH=375 /DNA_ID=CAMNT_0012659373 /DNA_START=1 /DNA_END=1128 /DNA_ORIENTATION=-